MLARVALDGLRKVVTIVEDVEREAGGRSCRTGLVAAGAVVENPFAGRSSRTSPLIGRLL